ncbi:MAG: glycine/sarcosine/betaine reductase component B subunit, partial [Nitrospirota bacterium]|nr:glycine/sarcosine/betaine reductase component B subunit [Nitrospirota bacterium]
MKLELAEFPVRQIRLGQKFNYQSEILEVNRTALLELIRQDARIGEASLAVASPGENLRVTGIRDMVEPRVKVAGSGDVFPGVLGP